MQRHIGTFTFEDQDFSSILEHAKRLEGKRLDEVARAVGQPDLLLLKGKGASGQLIQSWFGLHAFDGKPEADLQGVRYPDGRSGAVELKIVPLIGRRGGYRIKERCKVTNIDYANLLNEDWGKSRARKKLLSVLFVFYDYAGALTWANSQVKRIVDWEVDRELLKDVIQSDWQRTYSFVEEGRAHEISESDNMILGASTAGQGGETKFVTQPRNARELARKRAFSLKPAFLQTTYGVEENAKAFESVRTLSKKTLPRDLHQAILGSLQPYFGKTLGEIADELHIPRGDAKHAAALLMKRTLGVLNTKKRILELEAMGVRPKIIPVEADTFRACEAMSFTTTRLREFVEEDWENSELRANLDCLLMLPMFTESCADKDKWSRKLGRPFFWSPKGEEEAGIAKEWEMFRQEVLNGQAAYRLVNGKRVSSLTPASKTSFIHMRPKGPDASKDDVDPHGNKAVQLCFWLSQSFVHQILVAEQNRKKLI